MASLGDRIDAALSSGTMSFYDLAMALYPDRKSWRYQSNGGPPGCYMALSAGIRRYNFPTYRTGVGPGQFFISARPSPHAQRKER